MSNWSLAGEHFAPGAKQKPFTESWQCVQSKPYRERHFTWACYKCATSIEFVSRNVCRHETKASWKFWKKTNPNRLKGLAFNAVRRQVRVHFFCRGLQAAGWIDTEAKNISVWNPGVFSGPSVYKTCRQRATHTVPYPSQNTWTWNPNWAPPHQALFTLLPSGSYLSSVGAIFSESQASIPCC